MMSFHNRHCRNLGGRWWARRVVCRRAYAPFAAKWSEECTKQVGFLIGREIIVVCVRLFLQGWKKRKVIGQNKFGNWASSYGRDLDHRRICHKYETSTNETNHSPPPPKKNVLELPHHPIDFERFGVQRNNGYAEWLRVVNPRCHPRITQVRARIVFLFLCGPLSQKNIHLLWIATALLTLFWIFDNQI